MNRDHFQRNLKESYLSWMGGRKISKLVIYGCSERIQLWIGYSQNGAIDGDLRINNGFMSFYLSLAMRVYRKMGDVAMVQSLESIQVTAEKPL